MRSFTNTALLTISVLALAIDKPAHVAQGFDQPVAAKASVTSRNAEAKQAFEDAKFGLSIDWGIDSLLGKGQSVMHLDRLTIREYAKLAPRFNPTRFDAEAWVKLAGDAGAKYLTIHCKKADGFCMFDSKLSDYDVVDATPFHQDPLKALALACDQAKIKLFLSYSLLDWHHPDYFPLGKTGHASGRGPKGDWKRYVTYYQGQVRELCTNYGEIGGIWFEGSWDRPDADWDLDRTYRMIHELQPGALVGNNHGAAPTIGEDLQSPGPESSESSGASAAITNRGIIGFNNLPRESRLTINDSRGYNPQDMNFKSAEQLIQALVGAAGQGDNLRIMVAAGPDGTICADVTRRLVEIGKWLEVNGDSIYGTHQGPFLPQPWGVWTARGPRDHPRKIFIHILRPADFAPIEFDRSIPWTPSLHGSSAPMKLAETRGRLVLDLPRNAQVPIDTIVVMDPK